VYVPCCCGGRLGGVVGRRWSEGRDRALKRSLGAPPGGPLPACGRLSVEEP
jgi:hypothetical protein